MIDHKQMNTNGDVSQSQGGNLIQAIESSNCSRVKINHFNNKTGGRRKVAITSTATRLTNFNNVDVDYESFSTGFPLSSVLNVSSQLGKPEQP